MGEALETKLSRIKWKDESVHTGSQCVELISIGFCLVLIELLECRLSTLANSYMSCSAFHGSHNMLAHFLVQWQYKGNSGDRGARNLGSRMRKYLDNTRISIQSLTCRGAYL